MRGADGDVAPLRGAESRRRRSVERYPGTAYLHACGPCSEDLQGLFGRHHRSGEPSGK